MSSSSKTCDVLIIGAGMAGSCLARQLRLEQPELSVVNVDRKQEFDWWVGESTVEAFDDYAMRTLGLGPYLLKNHIPKHGLRFWFDSEAKDLGVAELSEHGRARYPGLNPGIQIDRATFDRDMSRMNRELGVEVLLGTTVPLRRGGRGSGDSIVLDARNGHRVETDRGAIECRYLVDATGHGSLLDRKLDLVDKASDSRFNRGAYWARVTGCASIDDFGDEAFHRRVDHTLRWGSTNHFMYDGYWVWLIPVTETYTSIGVTYDPERADLRFKNGGELLAFLRRHRALAEILGPATQICDFMGRKRMVRGARQFFSADRWYLCGMAGHFVDPLFSASSGLLPLGNRMICELIKTDRSGDDRLQRRLKHFNLMLRNIFLRQLSSFSRYHAFGSFDAFVNWKSLRYHNILNIELPMQRADFTPLFEMFDSHEDDCACAVGRFSPTQQLDEAADRLTDEFVAYLRNNQSYYARNRGYFHELTELPALRHRSTEGRLGDAAERQSSQQWEAFVRYFVGRMCTMEGVRFCEASFRRHFEPDWRAGQKLDELMSIMRRRTDDAAEVPADAELWNMKGPVSAYAGDPCMSWICRFLGPDGQDVL